MRKMVIMLVLAMMVSIVALPMGWCEQLIPNDRPMAVVNLYGELTVAPKIILKVNNTTAEAIGWFDYDEETHPLLIFGNVFGNVPTPGTQTTLTSGNYNAQVYSNDEWSFFIYRSNWWWSGNDRRDGTMYPTVEYSINGGDNWSGFNALERTAAVYDCPTTNNDFVTVGNFQFRAGFDAGSEPGIYGLKIGFVAYQE